MKKDIETREDLLKLVTRFYEKLLADPSISYLFTKIAKIDLAHHLQILVDFWDMVLFQSDTYRKNAMQVHTQLHSQSPLQEQHFKTWLSYFKESVNEFFEGPVAFRAKERAESIATMMRIKISELKNKAPR